MPDKILRGTRTWTLHPASPGFKEQFDAAVSVLCNYATDAIRLQSSPDIDVAGQMYFGSLSFETLGDLYGAVMVVGTTPQGLVPSSFGRFVRYLPGEWSSQEGIASLLEMIRDNVLNEQLRRVWASPASFARDAEFDEELGRRAMELSLPATQWSGPLSEQVVLDALSQLVADHERSKSDPEFIMELVVQMERLDRRATKDLKRQLRRGARPPIVQRCFSTHTDNLNQYLSHVVSFAAFVGWTRVRHPTLR